MFVRRLFGLTTMLSQSNTTAKKGADGQFFTEQTNNMEAKHKAYQIFEKMYSIIPSHPDGDNTDYDAAKKCALVEVDDILDALKEVVYAPREIKYFQEVKREIENL